MAVFRVLRIHARNQFQGDDAVHDGVSSFINAAHAAAADQAPEQIGPNWGLTSQLVSLPGRLDP